MHLSTIISSCKLQKKIKIQIRLLFNIVRCTWFHVSSFLMLLLTPHIAPQCVNFVGYLSERGLNQLWMYQQRTLRGLGCGITL